MTEIDAELVGFGAEFCGFFSKALIAFFDEVILRTREETEWVTCRHFEAVRNTPEHWDDFYIEFCHELEKAQDVIFAPSFNFFGRFFPNALWKERADSF